MVSIACCCNRIIILLLLKIKERSIIVKCNIQNDLNKLNITFYNIASLFDFYHQTGCPNKYFQLLLLFGTLE